jgi:hypothetical protein
MNNLRQAAQQVVDACTDAVAGWESLAPLAVRQAALASLDALRAVLEQPEPRNQCGETCERAKLCATCARELAQEPCNIAADGVCEALECCNVRTSEALCPEQVRAQPEQEPVAICPNCLGTRRPHADDPDWRGRCDCNPPRRERRGPSDAWKCACGANLYIDADGNPRSKANG